MISSSKKPIVSINLTPLVDVSLVLVVIFMATAPMFMQSGINVYPGEKKTDSDGANASATSDTITVKLDQNGIWINDRKIQPADLAQTLKMVLEHSKKKRVVIMPGDSVVHGDVIRVMDLAKQSGAKKLVIMGTQPNPGF